MQARSALAVLATATALFAQNDFDIDKQTPGTLGSTLTLDIRNAPPNAVGAAMFSFSSGPTPLAAIIPGETRSLQVGTELAGAWALVPFNSAGGSAISIVLPNNAAFLDLRLWFQSLTLATSGPSLVGLISNNARSQASLPGQGLAAPASLLAGRAFGAAFFDRDNDNGQGDVVVAGGGSGTLTAATGLASSEVWNFRRMTVSAGPTMGTARALHLAVPLTDGRVLLLGGADASGAVVASCEVYDPATNSFAPTGSMATPRVLHAACRLADGRVMVAGGTSSLVDTTTAITSTLNTVEIWNPATGTWSAGPAIGGRRLAPALTLLSNNQVMVSGGVEVTLFLGFPTAAVSTTAVQRWNPTSPNTWASGPNMSQGRAGHHYNQVELDNGRVLMTGGTNVPNLLGAANATPIQGAEVYSALTNSWTSSTMASARALHSATRLADGRVVVCGGAQGTLTTPTSIDGVELFTPATNSWTTLSPLTGPRAGHAAARLPDGTVVLFGGQGATTTLTSIETLRF